MYKNKRIVALVPAAGSGTRMGMNQKKQFLELEGKEILNWTLKHLLLCALIDEVVVIAPAEDCAELAVKISEWKVSDGFIIPIHVVEGGQTRQLSVKNGLNFLDHYQKNFEYVLIHDGVRPFLPYDQIQVFLDEFSNRAIKGVIAATPVTDTLKQVNDSLEIVETIDRSKAWAVQTPQVFDYKTLHTCHFSVEAENATATDDAALLEKFGFTCGVLKCNDHNIKITKPFDLLVAEAILRVYYK